MALTRATDKIIGNSDGNLNLSGIVTASSFSGPLVPSGDVNVGNNIKLGAASGIVTATSFSGDGSNLTSLPAGLGTALSSTQTSPLNKLYYTNRVLSIDSTTTVDHPATGTGAYTQYAEIQIEDNADLIIEDGDDLIPDILGLGDNGTTGAGGNGRLRIDTITNKSANGAPNFPNGLTGTTGTFSGNLNVGGVLTYEDVTNVDSVGVITARQGVHIDDSITHIGDSNTKIRFPANDTISFETAGERLRINSNGSVQVTPEGSTSNPYMLIDTSGDSVRFNAKKSSGNNELRFLTQSSGNLAERLRIGSSGQIGIAGANYGTSGQVLTSQGASSAVQWASPSGWVFGTAADYDQWNSLTDARFSGWPTNWQQIRISFQNISSNGNAYIQFFVSKSSDPANKIITTYENKSGHFGSSQGIDNDSNSAIMGRFYGTASAGYSLTGHVNFYNFRNDIVRYEGQCSTNNAAYMYMTNGKVECDTTAQMTHIFFRSQGYSWDSGRFKIDYLFG